MVPFFVFGKDVLPHNEYKFFRAQARSGPEDQEGLARPSREPGNFHMKISLLISLEMHVERHVEGSSPTVV